MFPEDLVVARHSDAIVIGSGLGALTAAALCAKGGLRVLVLERNEHCGGAAIVYRHGGLDIETSLHEIDGFDPDDVKRSLWEALGLDRTIELVEIDNVYEVRGGPFEAPFVLPKGLEAAKLAARERFLAHAGALEQYFERLSVVRGAVSFAGRHREDRGWWLAHAPEALRRLWPLLREDSASLAEVFEELFGDDEAPKIAMAANLPYYHDDPASILFVHFAVPQASYITGGGYYVRGGSRALTDRLLAFVTAAGGRVETGREAFNLRLSGGAVTGVDHRAADGQDVRADWAPLVFCGAAPHALAKMLPEAARAGFLAPYAHRRPSISLWTMSFGIDRPARQFGVSSYATFIVPGWMKALSEFSANAKVMGQLPDERLPYYALVDYGRIDSGLNVAGTSVLSLCGVDRLENWSGLDHGAMLERKERWMSALLADVDRHYPGLAGAVTHREMATAETMRRFLHTPGGAVYGFAPASSLRKTVALGPATRILGLWLASAFAGSGGFSGAMFSGAHAASLALRKHRGALVALR
jgi:phytoene dehydrogenase-like protein